MLRARARGASLARAVLDATRGRYRAGLALSVRPVDARLRDQHAESQARAESLPEFLRSSARRNYNGGVRLSVFAAALISVFCSACSSARSEIRAKAASALRCPESEIRVGAFYADELYSYADDGQSRSHKVARGCGQRAIYVCTPKSGSDSGSCDWRWVEELKSEHLIRRASYDLQCTPSQLEVTALGNLTTGVAGCGHRVTYMLMCPHSPHLWSGACTWVLNGQSVHRGPAP